MKRTGMNRRDFIKKSVECAAYTAATVGLSGVFKGADAAEQGPDLVVANGSPGPATRAAVEAMGGMGRYVRPKDKVVIKPNMSFPNPPEWGTTTHPDVAKVGGVQARFCRYDAERQRCGGAKALLRS